MDILSCYLLFYYNKIHYSCIFNNVTKLLLQLYILEMKSIMVYSKSQITGKKKVTMLNKMRMASKKYFCTNKNNEISVNNMRFLILEEVNNAEIKCTYPVLDNVLQLEDGSLIRGIIVKCLCVKSYHISKFFQLCVQRRLKIN